jgi:hypothetical protein
VAEDRSIVARYVLGAAVAAAVLLSGVMFLFREGIQRTALDPKQPFQTYRPPPAPDYSQPSAWAVLPGDPAHPAPGDPPADVFFVHSTIYDGGRDWNTPIDDRAAQRFLNRVDLPNYAGPFQQVGRVFAPRYRAASLYAYLTLRDDAREARRFAYRDVEAAFRNMLARTPADRPLILAGVGQGANLLTHLLQQAVDKDPALIRRVAGVYLMDAVSPAAPFAPGSPLPACASRQQAHCVMAWAGVRANDSERAARRLERALMWTPEGQLENLAGRPALCVNPLTGSTAVPAASERDNLGAANATGLEWGLRPAFLAHQVSAECDGGLLRLSRPSSPSLQRAGSWAERRKSPPYNLFYADIEADAEARVEALAGRKLYGPAAPPIQNTVEVRDSPIHHIY